VKEYNKLKLNPWLGSELDKQIHVSVLSMSSVNMFVHLLLNVKLVLPSDN